MKNQALFLILACLLVLAACNGDNIEDRKQMLETASNALSQRNFREAERIMLRYTNRNPKNADGFELLGSTYMQMQEFEKAAESFQQAVENNSQSVRGLIGLAVISRNKKEFSKSQAYYQRVIEIEPNNAGALTGLAVVAANMKNLDLAIQYGERAFEIAPNSTTVISNLALFYHFAGRSEKRDEMKGKLRGKDDRMVKTIRALENSTAKLEDFF